MIDLIHFSGWFETFVQIAPLGVALMFATYQDFKTYFYHPVFVFAALFWALFHYSTSGSTENWLAVFILPFFFFLFFAFQKYIVRPLLIVSNKKIRSLFKSINYAEAALNETEIKTFLFLDEHNEYSVRGADDGRDIWIYTRPFLAYDAEDDELLTKGKTEDNLVFLTGVGSSGQIEVMELSTGRGAGKPTSITLEELREKSIASTMKYTGEKHILSEEEEMLVIGKHQVTSIAIGDLFLYIAFALFLALFIGVDPGWDAALRMFLVLNFSITITSLVLFSLSKKIRIFKNIGSAAEFPLSVFLNLGTILSIIIYLCFPIA